MIYATCALGFVSLMSFMLTCYKKRSVIGVFNKALTSVFFILTALVASYYYQGNALFCLTVIAGLVCGLLGDVFLDLKWVYPKDKDLYLTAGFSVFAIGHFIYCFGMFKFFHFGWMDVIFPAVVGLVVALFNLIMEKPTKQNFGKFRAVVIGYAFVAAFMAGTALWAAFTVRSVGAILYGIGGTLFLISDLFLSPMYFKPGRDIPVYFFLNHLAYYFGQYLIALSIAFVN